MAETLEGLKAVIADVKKAVDADAAQDRLVADRIEALLSKIDESPAAQDFTEEVNALREVISTLETSNTGVQAELDKAGQ